MTAFFFFNDTATTEIYTLSLHDALPISAHAEPRIRLHLRGDARGAHAGVGQGHHRHRRLFALRVRRRSEEHTSELQSRQYLVCRLLLEKKKAPSTFPI